MEIHRWAEDGPSTSVAIFPKVYKSSCIILINVVAVFSLWLLSGFLYRL